MGDSVQVLGRVAARCLAAPSPTAVWGARTLSHCAMLSIASSLSPRPFGESAEPVRSGRDGTNVRRRASGGEQMARCGDAGRNHRVRTASTRTYNAQPPTCLMQQRQHLLHASHGGGLEICGGRGRVCRGPCERTIRSAAVLRSHLGHPCSREPRRLSMQHARAMSCTHSSGPAGPARSRPPERRAAVGVALRAQRRTPPPLPPRLPPPAQQAAGGEPPRASGRGAPPCLCDGMP